MPDSSKKFTMPATWAEVKATYATWADFKAAMAAAGHGAAAGRA